MRRREERAGDVSVSLEKLGDFLARRGQAGDVDRALGHYQRSLGLRERLMEVNSQSAEASRDVIVSLERIAVSESRRPDGAAKALEPQVRALEIAMQLRNSNPQSVFFGTTAVWSLFLAFQRAHATGQEELAGQFHARCFQLLDELLTAGCQLDPEMRNLHAQLKPVFQQDS